MSSLSWFLNFVQFIEFTLCILEKQNCPLGSHQLSQMDILLSSGRIGHASPKADKCQNGNTVLQVR